MAIVAAVTTGFGSSPGRSLTTTRSAHRNPWTPVPLLVHDGLMGDQYGGRTKEEYEKLLKEKLEPARIRLTLSFAGLFLLAHELIKHLVLVRLRQFYGESPLPEFPAGPEWKARYAEAVLSLDVDEAGNRPKRPNAFRASIKWLIEAGALAEEQAAVLDQIFDHRSDLAHELLKYLVDVDYEPKPMLLTRANEILSNLEQFWTQMEIDLGTFEEFGDVQVEDVQSPLLSMYGQSLQAFFEGLPPEYRAAQAE